MRAQVEVQMNWIYVMVVGGIIILLFVSIITISKKRSDQTMQLDSVRYLDSSIMATAPHGESRLRIPEEHISVSCGRITAGDIPGDTLEFIPLFSTPDLYGDIIASTAFFKAPFPVTEFRYLTDSSTAFVIEEHALSDYVSSLLPSKVYKKVLADISTFENQNYHHVHYIAFSPVQLTDIGERGQVTSISLVQEDTVIRRMYSSFSNPHTMAYIDTASLKAALISSSELYACNMEKALDTMKEIAASKKTMAGDFAQQYSNCDYSVAEQLLEEYEQVTDIEEIAPLAQQLSVENQLLQKLSCPTIY